MAARLQVEQSEQPAAKAIEAWIRDNATSLGVSEDRLRRILHKGWRSPEVRQAYIESIWPPKPIDKAVDDGR